jgi:beta-lactamase class A
MITRRNWLKGVVPVAAGFALSGRAQTNAAAEFERRLAELENSSGGRLGVAVLDTATGAMVGRRTQERFPLCSTSKVLVVGAVLARVDQGHEQLDRRVPVEQGDVLEYAPVTKSYVGRTVSLRQLCEAAIELSDNTAANLLMKQIGGPAGVTAYARSIGDGVTRLDRNEPGLNEGLPGDPRDTTAPAAMAKDLLAMVLGTALSGSSRSLLQGWMLACNTGSKRLRAGMPSGWKVADKTGTGDHGTANDAAVVWPQAHRPVVVTAYLTEAVVSRDAQESVLAGVGRAVSDLVQRQRG